MKLRSIKPYLIITTLASILYFGDCINASTFMGQSYQNGKGYVVGTTTEIQKKAYDAQREDPNEFKERIATIQEEWELVLKDYESETRAGTFDEELQVIEADLETMLTSLRKTRSPEGTQTTFEQRCSPEEIELLLASYDETSHNETSHNGTSDSEQRTRYVEQLYQTLTRYFSEEQHFSLFEENVSHFPADTILAYMIPYVEEANDEDQETFASAIMMELSPDKQYRIIEKVIAQGDEPLQKYILRASLEYSTPETKDELLPKEECPGITKQVSTFIGKFTQ